MAVDRRVTTQDISWFLDLERNQQLDLDPPYQRRSVWSPKDRRYFLDTIFRGYPSPSIFLHKQMSEGKVMYAVVDGKQRLETILKFTRDEIAIDKDFGDTRLAGKKWKAIRQDEQLARQFWDYVLPVEFSNIVDDTNLVKEVFDRLNRNASRLTEQELRHAKYDGWLITFVENEASSDAWAKLGVVTTARMKRMADVQFLSELLMVLLKEDVGGFDQTEISEFYAKYDDLSDLDFPFDEEQAKERFEKAKSYLLESEHHGSIVKRYARDVTNFYSLWAVVVLNLDRLPPVEEFAPKYLGFMDAVSKYKDEAYLAKVIEGEDKPSELLSLKYYQNSIGPRTEGPQREQRHQVLMEAMLGVHSP